MSAVEDMPPSLVALALDSAAAARATPAAETIRLYAADWAAFAAWCRQQNVPALPAEPGTVATYLTHEAGRLRPGALGRRLAAIGDRHRQVGLATPSHDPAIRALLRQARADATRRRRLDPSAAQLLRMAAACPGDLAGLRDRALLLLAARGLGRVALVGLDAEHVSADNRGVELRIVGLADRAVRTVQLPRAETLRLCPARMLAEWMLVSETRFGPVFRKIDRWGTVAYDRLGTDAIRRILAHRARLAKIPHTKVTAPAKPQARRPPTATVSG